jgi:hypothetical protein
VIVAQDAVPIRRFQSLETLKTQEKQKVALHKSKAIPSGRPSFAARKKGNICDSVYINVPVHVSPGHDQRRIRGGHFYDLQRFGSPSTGPVELLS